MYLLKRYLFRSYYIFIPLFFLILAGRTSFALAATIIKGKVFNSQNEPLIGIKVTAFDTNNEMIGGAFYYSDPDYELDVTWGGSSSTKKFYVCATDPNNKYIHECYGGVLFGYQRPENAITLNSGQTLNNVNFHLSKNGEISVNLTDIPNNDRGYRLFLEGTVDFKNTPSISFISQKEFGESELPDVFHFSDKLDVFPYGHYSVCIEDIHFGNYHNEVTSAGIYFYKIDTIDYLFNQYYDHKSTPEDADTISLSENNQEEEITFSSLSGAGMIYGLIRDPAKQNWKCEQGDLILHTDPAAGKSIVSYYGAEDPETEEWVEKITLVQDPFNQAIENIYVKLIPLNNQRITEPVVPSKILLDPNFDYHSGENGGYAFKFIEPTGEYKIQLFRRAGNTVIFNAYYKDENSWTFSEDEAGIIGFAPGEKRKEVNITLPNKVSIYGYVHTHDNGEDLKAENIGIDLLTTNREVIQTCGIAPICYYSDSNVSLKCEIDPNCWRTDPLCETYFSFEEFMMGDFDIRIAEIGYEVKLISLTDVQVGEEIWLGNQDHIIYLETYNPCENGGIYEIRGRVFLDEAPSIGLEDISVRASDVEHINDKPDCFIVKTNANGEFEIPNLPNSVYIVYIKHDITDQEDPLNNPNAPLAEMHKNIIPVLEGEDSAVSSMLQFLTDYPLNIQDPNVIAEVVNFQKSDIVTVNFGLSRHEYQFAEGLNLYAHPGEPNIEYGGKIRTFKQSLPDFSLKQFISLETSLDGNQIWELQAHKDPNHPEYDDKIIYRDPNYRIQAGRGYVLYLNKGATNVFLPPFRIYPPELHLIQGPNLISLPDVFEKGIHSRDVIHDFNKGSENPEENASCINHYNSRAGKWKSTTFMWGLPAGDDFKIERRQGYLVYMKQEIPSWKSPDGWNNN